MANTKVTVGADVREAKQAIDVIMAQVAKTQSLAKELETTKFPMPSKLKEWKSLQESLTSSTRGMDELQKRMKSNLDSIDDQIQKTTDLRTTDRKSFEEQKENLGYLIDKRKELAKHVKDSEKVKGALSKAGGIGSGIVGYGEGALIVGKGVGRAAGRGLQSVSGIGGAVLGEGVGGAAGITADAGPSGVLYAAMLIAPFMGMIAMLAGGKVLASEERARAGLVEAQGAGGGFWSPGKSNVVTGDKQRRGIAGMFGMSAGEYMAYQSDVVKQGDMRALPQSKELLAMKRLMGFDAVPMLGSMRSGGKAMMGGKSIYDDLIGNLGKLTGSQAFGETGWSRERMGEFAEIITGAFSEASSKLVNVNVDGLARIAGIFIKSAGGNKALASHVMGGLRGGLSKAASGDSTYALWAQRAFLNSPEARDKLGLSEESGFLDTMAAFEKAQDTPEAMGALLKQMWETTKGSGSDRLGVMASMFQSFTGTSAWSYFKNEGEEGVQETIASLSTGGDIPAELTGKVSSSDLLKQIAASTAKMTPTVLKEKMMEAILATFSDAMGYRELLDKMTKASKAGADGIAKLVEVFGGDKKKPIPSSRFGLDLDIDDDVLSEARRDKRGEARKKKDVEDKIREKFADVYRHTGRDPSIRNGKLYANEKEVTQAKIDNEDLRSEPVLTAILGLIEKLGKLVGGKQNINITVRNDKGWWD